MLFQTRNIAAGDIQLPCDLPLGHRRTIVQTIAQPQHLLLPLIQQPENASQLLCLQHHIQPADNILLIAHQFHQRQTVAVTVGVDRVVQ